MLASAGCAYQGTFRNPLADPYLLGVSAGAGLGATIAIFYSSGQVKFLLPIAAFIGALTAVFLTYSLGRSAISGRSSTALVLAGVAVASLLTAIQTLLQQQNTDKIREVYAWVLGRLSTSGWNDLLIITPYVAICILVLLRYRRVLDVFAVGDEEAQTMGLPVSRARGAIIVAASLGTAAAVSVTGLIGFVGIIVPHILRLIVGNSYRILLPLSVVYGGIFLVLADIFARTVLAPQEISIGVVTALLGAPFFLFVLGSSKNGSVT
jgi:iron complex transport system permease protein